MARKAANGRVKASQNPSESVSGDIAGLSKATTTSGKVRDGTDPRNPIRIYADGIFDLFHFGHARALEQAKLLYPQVHLIVGVCNDADTNRNKGKTVMTEDERYESVRHCKWVDQVVKDAPWIITAPFLEKHDIDFVAHDALPYADTTGQVDDVYGPVKEMGKFKETQRTEGVSTSDLILRIIKDYNDYVLRNLGRGYSREDLGLSLLKEKRIRASGAMRQLSARMRQQRSQVANKIKQRMALPPDVGRNVQGFATSLESLLDRVMSGEIGGEMVENMDKMVTGFIQSFEKRYHNLEKVIKNTLGRNLQPMLPSPKGKRKGRHERVVVVHGGGDVDEEKGRAGVVVNTAAVDGGVSDGSQLRASKRQRRAAVV